MELSEESRPARVLRRGYQSGIALAAGQLLKVETTPDGEEVLSAECPAGKAWEAYVYVQIEEVDA